MKSRINVLEKEIRAFFCNAKYKRVCQVIVPGNSGSLWKAVKVANDANINQLPNILFLNDVEIGKSDILEVFAQHFSTKIKDTLETINLNNSVYNGTRKIQVDNKCDITGINQHGFKRKRSTSTLTLHLQSIIGRALNEDKFVLVASLNLSAAFDIVNTNLLIKRLKIVRLPEDVIDLIEVWLKESSYYVSIDGINSVLLDLLLGTVQGSILGPVLYALFV